MARVLIVGCVACSGERYLPTPPFPAEVRAALYVFEGGMGSRQMYAASEADAPSLQIELAADAETIRDLWALGYPRRLDELHLAEGWVTLPAGGAETRAAPLPLSIHRRSFDDADAWSDGVLDELVGLVLPRADWPGCVARGGCLASVDDGDFCTTPCPAAAPLVPPSLDEDPVEGPLLTPCPTGWLELAAGPDLEPARCEPFPDGDSVPCADDEVRLPGGPGCERLGDACPVGPWPAVIPSGTSVLYVLPGASVGGDGSMLAPFGNMQDAYAIAPAGAVIVVGKGELTESLRVDRDLTVRGACVAETRWVGPVTSTNTIALSNGTLRISNLTVTGAGVAIRSGGTSALVIDDVAIQGPGRSGQALVLGRGARLEARRLSVRGSAGVGISMGADVHAALDAVSVSQIAEAGMVIDGEGTSASLDRVVISDQVGSSPLSELEPALDIHLSATATIARSVVQRAHGQGIRVNDRSRAFLTDVVVRQVDPEPEQNRFGDGVAVAGHAFIDARRLWVDRSTSAALRVLESGEAIVQDLLAMDIAAREGSNGQGAHCTDTTKLDLTRITVLRAHEAGIDLGNACIARLRELQIHRVLPAGNRVQSSGVSMQGGDLEVDRAVIGELEVGIDVLGPGGKLTLRDVRIVDTQEAGVYAVNVGPTLERVRIEGGESNGIFLTGPTVSTARDLEIRNFRRSTGTGCVAVEACDGTGLYAGRDAMVEVTRFSITDNEGPAASIGAHTAVILEDGLVSRNGVALSLTDPSTPLPPLFIRVEYRGNGELLRR